MAEITTIQPIEQARGKLRCGAYCRVSTDSSEQLHSYAAQRLWFTTLLEGSETEELVDIYADVGISGTTAERPEFMRMLDDCRQGRIDRILTKSVSRFARNTRDCLAILRELREIGVTICFEKEGIDTARTADEMMIAIMGGLAQEESRSISRNVRWSLRRKMATGTLGVARVPYGYDKSCGRLIINEEQAAVVRRIFSLYTGGMGARRIAALFNSEHLPAPKSDIWNNITIYKMLSQEMYIGDIHWQKTASVFMGASHPNTGQEDSFYVTGSHEPIIDRETFDTARSIRLHSLHRTVRTNNSPFRQKLTCGLCGRSYYLIGASRPYWQCTGRFDLVRPCTNDILHDDFLNEMWSIIWIKLTRHAEDILLPLIEQLENIGKTASKNAENGRLDEIVEQKMTLRKMCAEGLISYSEVLKSETELNAEYAALSESGRKRSEQHIKLLEDVNSLYKAVHTATNSNISTDILGSVRIMHDLADFELKGGIHIITGILHDEKRASIVREPLAVIRSLALCCKCGSRISRRKVERIYIWKCSNRRCSWWKVKHTDDEILSFTKDVFTRVYSDPRLVKLNYPITEYRPESCVFTMQDSLEKLINSGENTDMLANAAVALAEKKIGCVKYNRIIGQTEQMLQVIESKAELSEFLIKAVKHIYMTPDRIRVKFINGKTVRSERSNDNE